MAVVDNGSYAKAAEQLNKSQSTISYAIGRLEEQLPSRILTLKGRRAVLTPAGEVLYRRAKQLLNLADNVEQTAQCLADGWETHLSIAVDALVPQAPLISATRQFTDRAPQTRLTFLETTLSGTDEALILKGADIALTPGVPTGFVGEPLTDACMVATAHRNHPLARAKQPLTEQDLKQARQIVIRDSGEKRQRDSGWLEAEQRITVSHISTAIKMLEAGLGFAFVPQSYVQPSIDAGMLQRLNMRISVERRVPIYLVIGRQDHTGPAAKAFADIIRAHFNSMKNES